MDDKRTADNQPNTRQGEPTGVPSNTRPVSVITDGFVQNPRYTFVPIRTGRDERSSAQAAPGLASLPELPALPPSIQRRTEVGDREPSGLQPRSTQGTYGQGADAQSDISLSLKRRFPASGSSVGEAAEAPRVNLQRNDSLRAPAQDLATAPSTPEPVQGPRGLDKRPRGDHGRSDTPR